MSKYTLKAVLMDQESGEFEIEDGAIVLRQETQPGIVIVLMPVRDPGPALLPAPEHKRRWFS